MTTTQTWALIVALVVLPGAVGYLIGTYCRRKPAND